MTLSAQSGNFLNEPRTTLATDTRSAKAVQILLCFKNIALIGTLAGN